MSNSERSSISSIVIAACASLAIAAGLGYLAYGLFTGVEAATESVGTVGPRTTRGSVRAVAGLGLFGILAAVGAMAFVLTSLLIVWFGLKSRQEKPEIDESWRDFPMPKG